MGTVANTLPSPGDANQRATVPSIPLQNNNVDGGDSGDTKRLTQSAPEKIGWRARL